MTNEEQIEALIEEAKIHTFENNCVEQTHGVYGSISSDFQAWCVKVEDLVDTHYGRESAPGKLISTLDLSQVDGYFESAFSKQQRIVLGTLIACKSIKPKKTGTLTKIVAPFAEKDSVFIVHGQDNLAKTEAARFIEKLGLKPIILHEQVSAGKTIIEKLEEYSNVGFGIVLYTGCDLGGVDAKKLQPRARQNVVFEHGLLIGKIGRSNVCALVKGDIETPNDISGVVYVNMDNNYGWRFHVANELRGAGYDIDMNKL